MESSTTYASDVEEPKRRHREHSVSPATEFEKLKFKRPKVSAVRDFPACFEQINAQRNVCGDDSDAEPREIDHVEPLKNTLHPEKDDSSLWSLESNGPTDDGYYYSEDLDDATYKDPFEVLDRERSCKLELQYVLTKVFDFAKVGFERPKVSATRDFPAAFGDFGAQLANGSPDDSDEDIVELWEIDHVESDQQNSPHSETRELSPCSAPKVEADVARVTVSQQP